MPWMHRHGDSISLAAAGSAGPGDAPDCGGCATKCANNLTAALAAGQLLPYGFVRVNRAFAFLHPAAALLIAMFLLDAYTIALTRRPTKWR